MVNGSNIQRNFIYPFCMCAVVVVVVLLFYFYSLNNALGILFH